MLQDKVSKCYDLVSEVSSKEILGNNNKKLAQKNNLFFNTYENELLPTLKAYVVSMNLDDYKFSSSLKEKMNECLQLTKTTFADRKIYEPEDYNKLVKELKKDIKDEWETLTTSNVLGLKNELLILSLVCSKDEVMDLLDKIEDFIEWPINEEKVSNYKNAITRSKELLKDVHLDDEIKNFLIKVRDRSASLLDLSDSIMQWINNNGISANILLSIKS